MARQINFKGVHHHLEPTSCYSFFLLHFVSFCVRLSLSRVSDPSHFVMCTWVRRLFDKRPIMLICVGGRISRSSTKSLSQMFTLIIHFFRPVHLKRTWDRNSRPKQVFNVQGVFFSLVPRLKDLSTKKLLQARLGVSKPIYVNVDSPNLGFPYFNFLRGYQ